MFSAARTDFNGMGIGVHRDGRIDSGARVAAKRRIGIVIRSALQAR